MSGAEEPGVVTGVVEDADGNPVEGVTCILKRQSDNEVFETTTDAQGVYRFEGLREGVYHGMVRWEDSQGDRYNSKNKPYIQVEGPEAAPSLVSRWTFDTADTDGSTVIDVVGGNDGTLNGGVTTGVSGANVTYTTNEAYSFDGSDDYMSYPSLSLTDSVTVSAWVNLDTIQDQWVISNRGSGDHYTLGFGFGTNSDSLTFSVGDGSTTNTAEEASAASTGSWEHVLGLLDPSSGVVQLYLNGAIVSEVSTSLALDLSNQGTIPGQQDNSFLVQGDIDDPRIHNSPLTGREAFNLYENGDIRETTGTIIDDFEQELYEDQGNTLSTYYNGDTGTYSRQSTSVLNASTSLEVTGITSTNLITSTSGLPGYPAQGDTFEHFMEIQNSSSNTANSGILFGVQDSSNHYLARVANGGGFMDILEVSGGSGNQLVSGSITDVSGSDLRSEISWGGSGDITFTLYSNGAQEQSVTANSTTYTSGGIGWQANHQGSGVSTIFDTARIV